jgi:hypothetical protein
LFSNNILKDNKKFCVLSGEATNTNFIFFCLTRPQFVPTICRTRGEHANHYPTDVVPFYMWMFCITLKERNTKRFVQNWHSPSHLRQNGHDFVYNLFVFFICYAVGLSTCKIFWLCAAGFFSQLLFIEDNFLFCLFINLQVEYILDKCYNEP